MSLVVALASLRFDKLCFFLAMAVAEAHTSVSHLTLGRADDDDDHDDNDDLLLSARQGDAAASCAHSSSPCPSA